MTTIDDLGARAAAAAHSDATAIAAARVDAGLEGLRRGEIAIVSTVPGRHRRRPWIAIGAATAVAAAAAAVVVVAVRPDRMNRSQLVPAATATPLAEPVLSTTANQLGTSAATVVVATPDLIGVDQSARPEAYPAKSIFAFERPSGGTAAQPAVASADGRLVIVDPGVPTATVVDLYGTPAASRDVPLAVAPYEIVSGPGDVLYGLVQGNNAEMWIDAIALAGDRVGQVLASAPVRAVEFSEAPRGVLGHGPDGIIDRRSGEQLIGYVDVSGAPTTLGGPAHVVTFASGDLVGGEAVVHDRDGVHDWRIGIVRHPDSPFSYNGEAPPAPSSHGGAVVWTAVGPGDDAASGQPVPTEPVVAVLAADGTGAWYSLADGWQVASSDLDGTVLIRSSGPKVEFARLDPPQRFDFLDQPAKPHQRVQYASTLPTAATTAVPCSAGDVTITPFAEGVGGMLYGALFVRNSGDHACRVQGVPDVALLGDGGDIVQSTDPSLMVAGATATAVVLERDSWAVVGLGAVASNVCGGNQSSQLRVTIGDNSITVPFVVGRPFDPTSCDQSYDAPAAPGKLRVEPFIVIDAGSLPNDPLDHLSVVLDAPTTVHAGEVLSYDVVMSLANDEPYGALVGDGCPIYEESVGVVSAQLLLNCNTSGGVSFAPGESVRFHIKLAIPADAPTGPNTLSWTTTEPSGHTATTPITVLP